MGTVRNPRPVQLFTSIIFKDKGCMESAEGSVEKTIGSIMDKTAPMPFYHTHYYEKEMGGSLSRVFLLFDPLFEREQLTAIKLITNDIEESLSSGENRTVNIDPGYISLENIVLATTKGYAHRIYLNYGIFADLTLMYQNGTYKPLEWTYPDYGSGEIIAIFNKWRGILKEKIKGM